MRLLVIDEAYPSDNNLYADGFVHLRVKRYLEHGNEVRVAAAFKGITYRDDFDGVTVDRLGSVDDLPRIIEEWRPAVILVHFPTIPFIKLLGGFPNQPIVAWVHGFEALGWYRRLFNFNADPVNFARYIKGNLFQLYQFRNFIRRSNAGAPIYFNFVSRWMKNVAETDAMIRVFRSSVIPNPIDDNVFRFTQKPAGRRKDVLVIRPFKGRKYATDLVHYTARQLLRRGLFDRFRFTFAGAGVGNSPLGRELGGLANVRLIDRYLTQPEIVALHRNHGVFLCPTRQDAQGVSMCEAMASGLVPVTSSNTAIPEFVTDGRSGLLTNNRPRELAAAMLRLADDADLFERLSAGAAQSIREKAGIDRIIDQELGLINTVASLR